MRPLDDVFSALGRSSFRQRFHLHRKELEYLQAKGLPTVLQHAAELIEARLAPARIANDGKQTPFRGHPVFIAQHATATCCRKCLQRWHEIPEGRTLTPAETAHILAALARWLRKEASRMDATPPSGRS